MKVSQDVVTVPSLLCVCECMSFFLFLFFSLSQPPSHTFIYPHCLQLSHTPIPPSHTSCHVHSLQTLTSTSLITLPFKIHVPIIVLMFILSPHPHILRYITLGLCSPPLTQSYFPLDVPLTLYLLPFLVE